MTEMRHNPEIEAAIDRLLWEHPDRRRYDWITEFGSPKTGLFPTKHCVFCRHCTDIFYDATSGPYMFVCLNDDADVEYGDAGTCWYFEEDDEQ